MLCWNRKAYVLRVSRVFVFAHCLLKFPLGRDLRDSSLDLWRGYLCFLWKMDFDDSRELRITSGSIIGVIMLLLAMLPRDLRSDLIARLHHMSTQETLEREQATTAGSEAVASSAADPEEHLSDGELSELFEE